MKIGPFTVTPRRRRRRSVVVGPVRVRYPHAVRRLLDVRDLLSPPDRRRASRKRR